MNSQFTTDRPVLVRIAIPHFCRPQENQNFGYGSCRSDASIMRGVALSRCLGSVLSLARHPNEQLLSIDKQQIESVPPPQYPRRQLCGVVVDCHVFVTGDHWCKRELNAFKGRIKLHHVDLENPRHLPHAARDFLLADQSVGDADLSLYLEDDLVIHDRLYIDKLFWFLFKTNHQFCLMPHRYELTAEAGCPRFFIDGPIKIGIFPNHHVPAEKVASGRFWDGSQIDFDCASNPHSGSFSISAAQRRRIRSENFLDDGFIGPLETVATYTVLQHFPVLKPCWSQRDFLVLEHAQPSFLGYRSRLLGQA